MRDAAAGEVRVLRPQPDSEPESGGVLQGAPEDLRIGERNIRLRERDAAVIAELRHLGEPLPRELRGERADRIDPRQIEAGGATGEHLDEARLVERRIGVGRAGEARDAAGDGREHLRFERRLVLESGLPQPRGEVDEAGRDDEARSVEHALRLEPPRGRANADDAPTGNVEIGRAGDAVPRVNEPAVLDVELHAPPRIDITAIRTAMPNVTCGRITECGPSATDESISIPRFIGPGCITIASGLATASLSGVNP